MTDPRIENLSACPSYSRISKKYGKCRGKYTYPMDVMGNLRCWPPGHGLAVRIGLQNWESLVTPESLRKVRKFKVIRGASWQVATWLPYRGLAKARKENWQKSRTYNWLEYPRPLGGQTFTRQFVCEPKKTIRGTSWQLFRQWGQHAWGGDVFSDLLSGFSK